MSKADVDDRVFEEIFVFIKRIERLLNQACFD